MKIKYLLEKLDFFKLIPLPVTLKFSFICDSFLVWNSSIIDDASYWMLHREHEIYSSTDANSITRNICLQAGLVENACSLAVRAFSSARSFQTESSGKFYFPPHLLMLEVFAFLIALAVSQSPIFEKKKYQHSRNYDICSTSHEKYYLEALTMCFECFFEFIYSPFVSLTATRYIIFQAEIQTESCFHYFNNPNGEGKSL